MNYFILLAQINFLTKPLRAMIPCVVSVFIIEEAMLWEKEHLLEHLLTKVGENTHHVWWSEVYFRYFGACKLTNPYLTYSDKSLVLLSLLVIMVLLLSRLILIVMWPILFIFSMSLRVHESKMMLLWSLICNYMIVLLYLDMANY